MFTYDLRVALVLVCNSCCKVGNDSELHDFQVEFKSHRCQLELAATLALSASVSNRPWAQRERNGSLILQTK